MPQSTGVTAAGSAAEVDPGGVAGWAVDVMDALGAPGAGLVVALENLFPPIPSEVVLPLAGFAASQGAFSLPAAVAWTTLGSLVGALLLYGLGALVGRDRVRAAAVRVPLLRPRDVDVAERWFARHGPAAVFFGRMLPIVRSGISLPAGVERMPLARFVVYTAAGSAVWNTLFITAGFQLGERWHVVERYAGVLQVAVLAAAVLAVAAFVVRRLGPGRRAPRRPASRRLAGVHHEAPGQGGRGVAADPDVERGPVQHPAARGGAPVTSVGGAEGELQGP